MPKVRHLYESFGNGGMFGRKPNMLDNMTASQIADYICSGHGGHPQSSAMRVAAPTRRLHESADFGFPLTTGGTDSTTATIDSDEDRELHSAIVQILDSGDDSETKAAKIMALLGDDADDGFDDADMALQESLSVACRRGNSRAIVETAARLRERHKVKRIAEYLRGDDVGNQQALIGAPSGRRW